MKKWLTIALVLCVSQAEAQWNPDWANYEAEARVIGTWKGTFSGQSFEFAVWPSLQTHGLTGVMMWGDCKAVVNVGGFELKGTNPIEEANPGLEGYMYSFSSFPNQVRRRDNQCPGDGWPGYSTFVLVGDDPLDRLEMFGYGTYPKLKKYPSEVTRSAPSPQLTELINWRDQKTTDRVTAMAKEAVFDPAVSYLDLSERQVPTRLESAAGLTFVSVIGLKYQLNLTQAGKTREFYDLIVLDPGSFAVDTSRSVGDKAGTGEFVKDTQEMRIVMHRQVEGCGVVRYPETRYDLEKNTGISADHSAAGPIDKSWVLRSAKGQCAAISLNGYCRVQGCTRWYGEETDRSVVMPIITDSAEIANTQAVINNMSWAAE